MVGGVEPKPKFGFESNPNLNLGSFFFVFFLCNLRQTKSRIMVGHDEPKLELKFIFLFFLLSTTCVELFLALKVAQGDGDTMNSSLNLGTKSNQNLSSRSFFKKIKL